jgi:thiamine-phosphate pyrophosphorylase
MSDPAIDEEEAEPRFLLVGTGAEPAQADTVAAVLAALQPAALIVGEAWDHRLLDVARSNGAALLVEEHVDPETDGVHLTDPGRVAEIRKKLDGRPHERLILGADVGLSRHDAMVAGEDGADYVAFGERGRSADDAVVELVCWWREVTVMPCLAYAEDLKTVTELAALGTDFIGIGDGLLRSPDGALATIDALKAAIGKK